MLERQANPNNLLLQPFGFLDSESSAVGFRVYMIRCSLFAHRVSLKSCCPKGLKVTPRLWILWIDGRHRFVHFRAEEQVLWH